MESDNNRGLKVYYEELYGTEPNPDNPDNPLEPQNANVGECMFIAPSPFMQDSADCNYHAAFVIAKDGNDIVTSEVFADKGEKTATFKLYGNNDKAPENKDFDFEESYRGTFGGYDNEPENGKPVSGIIVPRNPI